MTPQYYVPKRAMAIYAHPDDIEFSCAGTLARWIQAGAEVIYILCTSGDAGIASSLPPTAAEPREIPTSLPPAAGGPGGVAGVTETASSLPPVAGGPGGVGITRAQAAQIREAEQLAAAAVIGVKQVIFLREPDGLLENTLTLRKRLVREIRRFRPEAIICLDPTALWVADDYINHPDHRAAGAAAIDAIFPAAGQPHVFEELAQEGLQPHKVRRVYVDSFAQGNTFIDITSTIDLKIQALKKHTSQFNGWDPEPMVREWAAAAAKGKEMTYAESFRLITLISDQDYAKITAAENNQ